MPGQPLEASRSLGLTPSQHSAGPHSVGDLSERRGPNIDCATTARAPANPCRLHLGSHCPCCIEQSVGEIQASHSLRPLMKARILILKILGRLFLCTVHVLVIPAAYAQIFGQTP